MLVLSRRVGERICIGADIVVTVVRVLGDKVRLGIDAPSNVAIHREEVFRRLNGNNSSETPFPTAEPPSQTDPAHLG